MRVAPEVKLSNEQRRELEKLARGRTVTVRSAQRAKMILMAASGLTDSAIGAELGVSRQNVARWRGRFVERGLTGIEKDAPRPGRKPQISAKRVLQIVRLTTHEKLMPPTGVRAAWPEQLALVPLRCDDCGKSMA